MRKDSSRAEFGYRDGNGLTIKNLRTFFWLARHRNYHLVATLLNVTQPAISARISLLEEELGVRLLSRSHQPVQLTSEGEEALRLCEHVLDGVDRLAARFSTAWEPSGIVRIGVVETVARTWLPALLEQIRSKYPGIDTEITTESTIVLHSLLSSGSLHMGISISKCEHADISNTEVGLHDMAWVASPRIFDPGHVYTPSELIELPLIGYLPMSPPAMWLERYFGEQLKDRIIHNTTNSMSTMIWLAESGLGIAAIPPGAIRQHLADSRLAVVKTEKAFEKMPFWLNWRTRPYSPVGEIAKSLIVEVARDSE